MEDEDQSFHNVGSSIRSLALPTCVDTRICQCAGEDDDGNHEDYTGCYDKEKVKEQKRGGAKEGR